MLKHLLFVFAFLFASGSGYGQDLHFDLSKITLADLVEQETKLGSEPITIIGNVLGEHSGNTLKFRRAQDQLPDLVVRYRFSKNDSILRSIQYEWDASTTDTGESQPKSVEYQGLLIGKFHQLEENLLQQFGPAVVKGDLTGWQETEEKGGVSQVNTWNLEDGTDIRLMIAISNFYRKRGMITTVPTHRIRLTVRGPAPEEPKMPLSAPDTLQLISKRVLQSFRTEAYLEILKHLDAELLRVTSLKELRLLRTQFDFEQPLVLSSTVRVFKDNQPITMLEYEPLEEPSGSETSVVRLTFNEQNQIVELRIVSYKR